VILRRGSQHRGDAEEEVYPAKEMMLRRGCPAKEMMLRRGLSQY